VYVRLALANMMKSISRPNCSFKANVAPRLAKVTPVRSSRPTAGRLVVEARSPMAGVGILGTKAGMMSYFTESGDCVPATVIALEDGNYVTQLFTMATNGYVAVQVGYKAAREKNVKKPERGHLAKAGVAPMKHLKEWRLRPSFNVEEYTLGKQLNAGEMFKAGDVVDVSGTSIGKGFQGSIKRWNMSIGPMAHGSKSHRQHGSIGSSTTPQRVFPGMKMAGHMGNERKTIENITILKVDMERQAIVVMGCVPGKPGGLIEIVPAKVWGKNWSAVDTPVVAAA
jgi:large subunit ribosomal protein L3